MKWLAIILAIVLFLTLGIFIGKSCSGSESLTSIQRALAERDSNLVRLHKRMGVIDSMLKALKVEKNEIKNYYTTKYYEIDSLANLDSLVLYSIIRARTERLYQLPGFFFVAIRDTGTGKNSENPDSR